MNKFKGLVCHRQSEIKELRADRVLAIEYLRAILEFSEDPEVCESALAILREAYGEVGLWQLQKEASIKADCKAICQSYNAPTRRVLQLSSCFSHLSQRNAF